MKAWRRVVRTEMRRRRQTKHFPARPPSFSTLTPIMLHPLRIHRQTNSPTIASQPANRPNQARTARSPGRRIGEFPRMILLVDVQTNRLCARPPSTHGLAHARAPGQSSKGVRTHEQRANKATNGFLERGRLDRHRLPPLRWRRGQRKETSILFRMVRLCPFVVSCGGGGGGDSNGCVRGGWSAVVGNAPGQESIQDDNRLDGWRPGIPPLEVFHFCVVVALPQNPPIVCPSSD